MFSLDFQWLSKHSPDISNSSLISNRVCNAKNWNSNNVLKIRGCFQSSLTEFLKSSNTFSFKGIIYLWNSIYCENGPNTIWRSLQSFWLHTGFVLCQFTSAPASKCCVELQTVDFGLSPKQWTIATLFKAEAELQKGSKWLAPLSSKNSMEGKVETC